MWIFCFAFTPFESRHLSVVSADFVGDAYLWFVFHDQISKDDGVRPGTSMQILSNLKPAFKENGSTTAGEKDWLMTIDDQTLSFDVIKPSLVSLYQISPCVSEFPIISGYH